MVAPDDLRVDLDADLDAAVAQGIITDAQATALRALVAKRASADAAARGDEERFRFMRGFNDFFFASGVLLFGLGAAFFANAAAVANAVGAATMWTLAELLVARLRLVLPGLLLVAFFAYFIALSLPLWSWVGEPYWTYRPYLGTALGWGNPAVGCGRGLLVTLAGLAFFARFRFPFALLAVAGGPIIAVMALSQLYPGWINAYAVLLACGLLVFAAAMAFDVSDRERVTRRADCAFWLHLLAAPLIVHSLVWLVAGRAINYFEMTSQLAATIVAIVVVLALVAVVIDRRALLVSTLAYLGIVIAYALKSASAASVDQEKIFFATLLALGAMVLVIGVAWLPLRRALMTLVPARAVLRLPPVVHAA